jgi:hypothetical protein
MSQGFWNLSLLQTCFPKLTLLTSSSLIHLYNPTTNKFSRHDGLAPAGGCLQSFQRMLCDLGFSSVGEVSSTNAQNILRKLYKKIMSPGEGTNCFHKNLLDQRMDCRSFEQTVCMFHLYVPVMTDCHYTTETNQDGIKHKTLLE